MKQEFFCGDVVASIMGRDKGREYIVVSVTEKGVAIVDGRKHKTTKPKIKNAKHLIKLKSAEFIELAERIKRGEPVANEKVKSAIASLQQ